MSDKSTLCDQTVSEMQCLVHAATIKRIKPSAHTTVAFGVNASSLTAGMDGGHVVQLASVMLSVEQLLGVNCGAIGE